MKHSRTRRTSDKLAVYRAATVKRGVRPNGAHVPTRTSPRRKPSTGEISPVDSSKNTSSGQSRTGTRRESGVSTRGVPRGTPAKGHLPTHASNERSPPGNNLNEIEDLETIPETPPRHAQSQRKRMSTDSELDRNDACHSDDESEKPSKKRRTFKTPPRDLGSSAEKKNGPKSRQGTRILSTRTLHERVTACLGTENSEQGDGFGSNVENHVSPETYQRMDRRVLNGENGNGHTLPREDGDTSSPLSGCKNYVSSRGSDAPLRNAEPSAFGDEVLDVLSISSATVSRLIEGFSSRLISELTQMQRETVNEMRAIAHSVNESVSSDMRHFEGIFTMLSRNMNSPRGSKSTGKTSLNEWEAKLNALTTDTDVIFNKEILGWLLAYNSPNTACWVFQNHGEIDVEKAAMSAQTLLFSLQPGDKKFSYSGKVGTLHSEFKFTVIRNAFYNMHWDSFALFRKPSLEYGKGTPLHLSKGRDQYTSSYDSSVSRQTERAPNKLLGVSEIPVSRKIRRPSWLENKVTLDHINEARNFLERPNQSRKKKIRQTPSPFDIVCHGALRVYRLLGNYLHVRRGAVRNSFFQSLGYLLVPWSQLCGDVNQQSLNMKWCAEANVRIPIESIPCTEKCAFVSGSDVVTAADARNNGLLRSLFSDWPQLVLSVEHIVYVVNGSGVQRKHAGGEPTTIRRLFNLVDVAFDFCVEFCGVGSRETFLRAHKYALRCVMIFALLFKAFLDKFMEHRDAYDSRAAGNRDGICEEFPDPMDYAYTV